MRQLLILIFVPFCFTIAVRAGEPQRPNFVLICAEDISPDLGCYGNNAAITPNLDRFASQGGRYTHCFSHAPVCAPSRSGIITGMYPTTIGSMHMRSKLVETPPMFTEELRKGGYFVAWPGKTDFNFDVPDGSEKFNGRKAFDSTKDWLDNPPSEPFLAYVNFAVTHEGQSHVSAKKHKRNTSRLKPDEIHDPAKVPLPPYYPDAPEVRQNVANYYDNVTAMDYQVGDVLSALKKHNLLENTVVIIFGDHGWGMPRGKRWLYDSGLRVPFLVRWPGHIEPNSVHDELVSLVDIGPTILSLARIPIPERMQGKVFLGKEIQERKYAFAARDRMDEAYDRIRAVRDKRFKYIRNFYPELPYSQYTRTPEQVPTMKVWRRLNEEGKLTGPQKLFFAPTKPKEELYDCQNDPHEIHNLADSSDHQEKLKELRTALDRWIVETKDLGDVPETELIKRGLVKDVLSEYQERLKDHPPVSKTSSLPPK